MKSKADVVPYIHDLTSTYLLGATDIEVRHINHYVDELTCTLDNASQFYYIVKYCRKDNTGRITDMLYLVIPKNIAVDDVLECIPELIFENLGGYTLYAGDCPNARRVVEMLYNLIYDNQLIRLLSDAYVREFASVQPPLEKEWLRRRLT